MPESNMPIGALLLMAVEHCRARDQSKSIGGGFVREFFGRRLFDECLGPVGFNHRLTQISKGVGTLLSHSIYDRVGRGRALVRSWTRVSMLLCELYTGAAVLGLS